MNTVVFILSRTEKEIGRRKTGKTLYFKISSYKDKGNSLLQNTRLENHILWVCCLNSLKIKEYVENIL
jgi:hypothetical protein